MTFGKVEVLVAIISFTQKVASFVQWRSSFRQKFYTS